MSAQEDINQGHMLFKFAVQFDCTVYQVGGSGPVFLSNFNLKLAESKRRQFQEGLGQMQPFSQNKTACLMLFWQLISKPEKLAGH